jgi:hypothetical protein
MIAGLIALVAVGAGEGGQPGEGKGTLLIRQFEFGFLGNIMFEYASAIGIAADNGLTLQYVDEHSLLTYSGKNSSRKTASLLQKLFPNVLARKVECDFGEDDMVACTQVKCSRDLCRYNTLYAMDLFVLRSSFVICAPSHTGILLNLSSTHGRR